MTGELEAIANSDRPTTTSSLIADLYNLGVRPDMTVMVHASLSKLGFVVGGAQAVVMALLDAVGPEGTLMMPTHSGALSDPANWQNPPVPESWWQTIRDEMPAFDPATTPTRGMGAIVDCFRTMPGVQRSNHPTVSAAAIGPRTQALIADHDLHDRLGETRPKASSTSSMAMCCCSGSIMATTPRFTLPSAAPVYAKPFRTAHRSLSRVNVAGLRSPTSMTTIRTLPRSERPSPRQA